MVKRTWIWFTIAILIFLILVVHPMFSKANAETAKGIAANYLDFIKTMAAKYGVPWTRIAAQVFQESRGVPGEIGSVGERGLMQIRPDALHDVNVRYGLLYSFDDMFSPSANIEVGTAYLAIQLSRVKPLGGGIDEATQAYNAGFGNWTRNHEAGLAYLSLVKDKEQYFQSM